MLKNFSLPPIPAKDPRVVMRAIIGLLLAANLGAAIMAFHPFGGGADDLRRQQQMLTTQLSQLRTRLEGSRKLVDKVQAARSEGDEFMSKYFMNSQQYASQILAELVKAAGDAGVKVGTESWSPEEIEGSSTLHMLSTQVGLEGSYANLTKLVNLIDKSPRFLIIEYMQASAPQQQQQQQGAKAAAQPEQNLNVTLKIDAFVQDLPGARS